MLTVALLFARAAHGVAQVPEAPAVLPSLDSVKVVGVARLDQHEVRKGARVTAGLGDIIRLRVRNLQRLVNYTKCLSETGSPVTNCTEQEISLYLDGREIRGLTPESGAPRPRMRSCSITFSERLSRARHGRIFSVLQLRAPNFLCVQPK